VPPAIPQTKDLIYLPSNLEEIAATNEESTPPESKNASGLFASSLLLILFTKAVLILSK
jgi:hypothetical protein